MNLVKTKDYNYIITNDVKVSYENSYILYILQGVLCSLAPNGLTTQLID